jgi:vancomycin resistance protein YoaR
MRLKKQLLAFLLGAGISLAILITSIALYQILYYQKVYPVVKIAGHKINAKNLNNLKNTLLNLSYKQTENELKFFFDKKIIRLKAADIKLKYLPHQTSYNALALGRDSSFIKNIVKQLELRQKGANLPFLFEYDLSLLHSSLASFSASVYKPIVAPSIKIIEKEEGKQIVIDPGKDGYDLDWQNIQNQLDVQLAQLDKVIIKVTAATVSSSIKAEQLEPLKLKAAKFLDHKITLTHQDQSWEVDDYQIIDWLNYSGNFDESKIASYAAYLAKSINRPAENALFRYESGRVVEFKPAQTGLSLKEKDTINSIVKTLVKIESKQEYDKSIILPVNSAPAKVSTADSNNFGISGLLGKGESWFYHSIAGRIHNVGLASSKFDGILIEPGKDFSFNANVGEISAETGYQQAYIIKEGRTILGDGGGVCQVSTTLFRAALQSGLKIISRTPHAYRVSYYEQNSPVGLDATVYEPKPDLVFTNNTNSHILIQRIYNPSSHYLAFAFYGNPDGRQIYISQSRLWDQSPPPPDLYQDDPSLPAGTVKQVDWSAWGAKTAFDYKVTLNSEILQEKTFYSNYKPWQAVFLKGTGP